MAELSDEFKLWDTVPGNILISGDIQIPLTSIKSRTYGRIKMHTYVVKEPILQSLLWAVERFLVTNLPT